MFRAFVALIVVASRVYYLLPATAAAVLLGFFIVVVSLILAQDSRTLPDAPTFPSLSTEIGNTSEESGYHCFGV
jgi:hypothetical protein